MNSGEVWVKDWYHRQVLRVEGDNVHWRNLGGKDRVSSVKNFTKWLDGAKLLNLSGDVSRFVLEELGAEWPGAELWIAGELLEVCELDGRYYLGRGGNDFYPVSKKLYDAFVEEFQ